MRSQYTLWKIAVDPALCAARWIKSWSLEAYTLTEAEISFRDNGYMLYMEGFQYLITSDR